MTLSQLLSNLSSNKYLVAVSNVFLMALPISLISTFCDLTAIFSQKMGWNTLSVTTGYVGQMIAQMFPILINIYLSSYLASIKRIPKSVAIATSLVVFFLVSQQWNLIAIAVPLPNSFALALLSAYLSCHLIFKAQNLPIFRIDPFTSAIDNSGHIISICAVSIIVMVGVSTGIRHLIESIGFHFSIVPELNPLSFTDGLLYEFLRGVFWSFGINGHNVLHMYKTELYSLTTANIADWQNFGVDLNIVSTNFYDFFTGIGGSGNTLSLVLCILLFARSRNYRTLAKTVLILSLFNINEPILFGIPVIFNPIMIIPFLLVPMVSFMVAYGAIAIGWVPPLSTVQSWIMPPLVSGYLGTGAISGALLQLIIIIIGIGLYYPFFKFMDKRSLGVDVTSIFNNRFFTSDEIEAKSKLTSFIPSLHKNLQAQREVEKLQQEGEFILYFQPQVDIHSKKVVAMETLLRYRDSDGNIRPPTFLSSFTQLGLMPELDFWVIERSVQMMTPLAEKNPDFKLSINVSPTTVLTKDFVFNFAKIVNKSVLDFHQLEVEITEELLVQDENKTSEIIKELQLLGVSVALDDFGTGYSSLAYLSRFEFNKIKIDRSLVLNLNSIKGQELFSVVVQLGKVANAKIIVEGVETDDELHFISLLGVRYVQGFYYYKPMPLEEIVAQKLIEA